MKGTIAVMALVCATATLAVLADPPPKGVLALRLEQKGEGKKFDVLYKYEKDKEHVTPAAQAALRAKEAAKAWAEFNKGEKPVALLTRSPFGGGETPGSYWPAGVKAELINTVLEPLTKAGLKIELAEPLPTTAPATAPADPDAKPRKPWPKVGFDEDFDFALLIGMHHEPIPYEGVRRDEEGKVVYFRSHRMTAWAILFYSPTATACWGTSVTAAVKHEGVEDPVNLAAETVLSYLDLSDIGKDNIPDYIDQLAAAKELAAVDVAAMLVQSQRADGVAAVLKAGQANTAYKVTAWVLRQFNSGGTAQDYRLGLEAGKPGLSLAAQRVAMRLLLLEQLRGLRAVQPAILAAIVPLTDDLDMYKIGRQYAGQMDPLGGDEEIVLIAELANYDPNLPNTDAHLVFGNLVGAIRSLGHCRVHMDEAAAVAKYYADRPEPPPQRGRPGRRDPLKEAGAAALADLRLMREEQQQKAAAKVKALETP